jgi:hypothetical protein
MTTGMFRLTQSKSGPFPIYDLSTGLQQSKTTVSVVELELPILPEHMSLLTVLGGVRVGRSLVFLQQTEHTRGHL